MRKTIGLEELEPIAPMIEPADPVENAEASLDGHIASVEAEGDQLAEASGIRDAISETVLLVRGGADATALMPVLEHLQSRLGSKVKILTMEDIATNDSAADKLAAFLPALDRSLEVAQEGLGNRILSGLEHFFRTYNGIEDSMHAAVGKLKASGTREDDIEADFSASEIYRRIKKTEISGADVLKLMKDLDKNFDKLVPYIKKATAHLQVVTRIFESKVFVAQDGAGDKIHSAFKEIQKLEEEAKELTDSVVDDGLSKKVGIVLKPLDADTATKLADFTSMMKRMRAANDLLDELNDTYWRMVNAFIDATERRLLGNVAEDVRAFRAASGTLKDTLFDALWDLANVEKRIVFANYRYIKASIAK